MLCGLTKLRGETERHAPQTFIPIYNRYAIVDELSYLMVRSILSLQSSLIFLYAGQALEIEL